MSGMLILQFLVLTTVVSGVLIFFLHRTLIKSTDGAVNRLNKETEDVRTKQSELNQKIKEANEELEKRKKEAEALVTKMTAEAEEAAKAEREKIVNKARQDGEEIIKKAQGTKDDIRAAIEKQMELKAVDFTVKLLAKVLSEKAQGALDQQLTQEFLDALEKIDMSLVAPEVDTAEIITAHETRAELKASLAKVIKSKLNRDIKIKATVDPKIVSGAILRFGSLNLDGSLQNLLIESGIAMKEKIEKGD